MTPENDKTINITVNAGDVLALRRVANETRIFINDTDTKSAIGRDNILVVNGNGDGRLIFPDNLPTTRVRINTRVPVAIDGSVIIAAGSTQSAIIDITPAALTGMTGLVSKKVKNPQAASQHTEFVMDHKLEAPNGVRMLGRNNYNVDPASMVLEYTVNGKKRFVSVEPKIGDERSEDQRAVAQFINFRDSNRQLMTLDNGDTVETANMRLAQVANEAKEEFSKLLDVRNNMRESRFSLKKEELGIPAEALRGRVEYTTTPYTKNAYTDIYMEQTGKNAPPSGMTASAPKSWHVLVAQKKSTPPANALRKNIIDRTDRWMNVDHKDLLAKGFPIIERKNKTNPGPELGDAMRNLRDAADLLYHERTDELRPEQLSILKKSFNDIRKISDEIIEQHDAGGKGKHAPRIVAAVKEMREFYENAVFRAEQIPEWSMDSQEPNKKENKRSGMLDAPQGGKSFDKLAIPEDMPKLAVADVTETPAPLAGALPRIEEFLKSKSGSKGAA